MKEKLKSIKWSQVLFCLLYLILGISLFIWPDFSNTVLCYAVAGVLTAYGLFNILVYFFGRERGSIIGLVIGIICIAFGIFALVQPNRISGMITVLLGVMITVGGAINMRRSLALRKADVGRSWLLPFVTDVLITLAGLMLTFIPGEFGSKYFGFFLVFVCFSDFSRPFIVRKYQKRDDDDDD